MPLSEAVERIPHGASVMVGGFIGSGSPHRLIDELVRQQRGELTLISNDTARPGFGIGKLIDAGLLKADFALISARRADYFGNLEYAMTARNFNPLMALAGAQTLVEAEAIVPVGTIPPDAVVTPGVLVTCLIARSAS